MESSSEQFHSNNSPVIKSKFVRQLLSLVENQSHSHIVSWSLDGNSLLIKDVVTFTNEILSKYYKHNSLSNFIRLLNMYGFKKVRRARVKDSQLAYQNLNFTRNRTDLLCNVERKKPENLKATPLEESIFPNEWSILNKSQTSKNKIQLQRDLNNEMMDLTVKLSFASNTFSQLLDRAQKSKLLYDEAAIYSVKLELLIKLLNLMRDYKAESCDSLNQILNYVKLSFTSDVLDHLNVVNEQPAVLENDHERKVHTNRITSSCEVPLTSMICIKSELISHIIECIYENDAYNQIEFQPNPLSFEPSPRTESSTSKSSLSFEKRFISIKEESFGELPKRNKYNKLAIADSYFD